MLIQLAHDLPDYFYDVFVTRLDFWVVFGIVAQLVFGSRFILQWIARKGPHQDAQPVSGDLDLELDLRLGDRPCEAVDREA